MNLIYTFFLGRNEYSLAPTKSGNLFKNLFQARVLLVTPRSTFEIINCKIHVSQFFFLCRKNINTQGGFFAVISNKVKFRSISTLTNRNLVQTSLQRNIVSLFFFSRTFVNLSLTRPSPTSFRH